MANFLENALPTIGGVAGGILGGIGGAVAAPFTGGIINPVDAGIAGSGLLGGAGQAAKNALTGQKVLQGNVVGSALTNAASQGVGEGLGFLGKGLLGKLGGLADNGATGLLQGQFAKGAIDNDTAGALHGMGITDANQIGQIHPIVTGENGALSTGLRRGLSETGMPADLSGLQTEGNNLIADNQTLLNGNSIPELSSRVNKALMNSVNPEDILTATTKGSGPNITSFTEGALKNVDPEKAFNMAQEFESLANTAKQGAFDKSGVMINPDQAAKYKVYQGLAEHARNAAFGNGNPIPLSDANKSQIISDLSPLKDINPQVHNAHVSQVMNAQNLQDLRGIQAPMVRANNALNFTQKVAGKSGGLNVPGLLSGGTAALGIAKGNPLEALGGAAGLIATHPAAGKVGASVLDRVGNILTNPTIQKAVQEAAAPVTTAAANVPGYTFGDPQGGAMQPTAQMTGQPGLPGAQAPATTASPEALQMMIGLLGLQADPYMASSFAPMVSNAVAPIQKAETAQSALQGLQGLYGQAGGGQGGIGGVLARLQSLVPGTTGHLYNQQAGQLEQTLGGLGVPATATPSLFSGAPTAQSGFGTLQQIINSLGGNAGSVLAGVHG